MYHCKEAKPEKCNVIAYEVGGKDSFRRNRFDFATFAVRFPCMIKLIFYGGQHMLEYRYDTQLLIEGKELDEDAMNDYSYK